MIDLNELEAAINRCAFDGDVLGLSKAECRDLLKRLRQSEKDAARYRWLRDQCCGDWETDGVEMSHIDVTMWINDGFDNCNYGESLRGSEMDLAIDEAMSARNGGDL